MKKLDDFLFQYELRVEIHGKLFEEMKTWCFIKM